MTNYKTPGVYVLEESSFGSSIVANPTAVPVFIGYTEKATNAKGDALPIIKDSNGVHEPVMVSNMLEYQESFGGADATGTIALTSTTVDGKSTFAVKIQKATDADTTKDYEPGFMYDSVDNFFIIFIE